MRVSNVSLLAMLLCASGRPAAGQVVSPPGITDPTIRDLQQSHLGDLQEITAAIAGQKFPYHFYFSRRLDISERAQELGDQRSIQFDRFHGQIVLKITGNYFAAYNAALMTKEERARRTYLDVMLPLLHAAVPVLARAEVPDSFALEISHHVLRKVLGVDTEFAENVVLILPKASAQHLIAARDEAEREAAVLEGSAYLNGALVSFWPGAQDHRTEAQSAAAATGGPRPSTTVPGPDGSHVPLVVINPQPAAGIPPPTALQGGALKRHEAEHHDVLARMVNNLDAQAHFATDAPPSFIVFRGAEYLQIPLVTTLAASESGSQYKLAALAFDHHVAHLIRPVLGYFNGNTDFAGIDFNTSVRLAGANPDGGAADSVEFVFPLSALRSYEQFNLTGQQLIDAGVVLINGERAGLDLQVAEAGAGGR